MIFPRNGTDLKDFPHYKMLAWLLLSPILVIILLVYLYIQVPTLFPWALLASIIAIAILILFGVNRFVQVFVVLTIMTFILFISLIVSSYEKGLSRLSSIAGIFMVVFAVIFVFPLMLMMIM